MSKDLTSKLPKTDCDKLNLILTAVRGLETRVDSIDSRLQHHEQKLEERLYDTRPIWHKVVADIAQLQAGQQRLEAGQQRLEEGQLAMRAEIGGLEQHGPQHRP